MQISDPSFLKRLKVIVRDMETTVKMETKFLWLQNQMDLRYEGTETELSRWRPSFHGSKPGKVFLDGVCMIIDSSSCRGQKDELRFGGQQKQGKVTNGSETEESRCRPVFHVFQGSKDSLNRRG
jgi:hypothetical protein